jgi:uncharacterized protein YjiS (DUF1127 family)
MAFAQEVCHARRIDQAPYRRLLAEMRALIAEWRRRARARRELGELCDRCLRDIGATRSEALREIRKPFWRA